MHLQTVFSCLSSSHQRCSGVSSELCCSLFSSLNPSSAPTVGSIDSQVILSWFRGRLDQLVCHLSIFSPLFSSVMPRKSRLTVRTYRSTTHKEKSNHQTHDQTIQCHSSPDIINPPPENHPSENHPPPLPPHVSIHPCQRCPLLLQEIAFSKRELADHGGKSIKSVVSALFTKLKLSPLCCIILQMYWLFPYCPC